MDPSTPVAFAEVTGRGAAPGSFYFPSSIAVAAKGLVYEAEPFQNRVQIFDFVETPIPHA
jgi:hypothetical protein